MRLLLMMLVSIAGMSQVSNEYTADSISGEDAYKLMAGRKVKVKSTAYVVTTPPAIKVEPKVMCHTCLVYSCSHKNSVRTSETININVSTGYLDRLVRKRWSKTYYWRDEQ